MNNEYDVKNNGDQITPASKVTLFYCKHTPK